MTLDRSLEKFESQQFENEDLSYEEFNEKRFVECLFTNCNFTETTFFKCGFVDCRFHDCTLGMIKLDGCTFSNTHFEASSLRGVNWSAVSTPEIRLYCPVTFSNCMLDYASFFGMNLKQTRIHGCMARNADFREADLSEADLTHTDFTDSEFDQTNLTGADLRDAKNYRIDVTRNKIKKAHFSMPEAMSLLYMLGIDIN
ncbi:Pentapeptide repeat-containing protein [Sulfidibacter corallicola]|uniref:Pentapeptide repeat-containing protein n=1 Tax=Sulfidibacter corallicola TaxID=2818388 RepID=A0A8A4TQL8_SULCO|nr:pentapeptide repeat-containing protein [Sulfidibacter corallicola]QTD48835.1 pentapeptide repeat-containing protein [Sulfidibacter corallicola]